MDLITTPQLWMGTGPRQKKGTDWNLRVPGTAQWNKIDWVSSISAWLAVGQSGIVALSFDGTNWRSTVSGGVTTWTSFATASDGRIVVLSTSTITSRYGSTGYAWTNGNPGGAFYDILSTGTTYVAVGGPSTALIRTSTDGINWTTQVSALYSILRGVAHNGSLFVAVGDGGTVLTSSDAVTWTQQTSGTANALNKVIWSSSLSLFIAVGNTGTIITSSNGTSWTTQTSGTTNNFQSIRDNGSIIVAVGASGMVRTSTNATTWTNQTANAGTHILYAVGWNGTKFVAGGQGGITIESTNGTTWTRTYHGENYKYGVTYAPSLNLWAAAGGNAGQGLGNIIVTSPDGITWTERTSTGSPTTVWNIKWSESQSLFVSVGGSGIIRTSPDAVTWTQRTTGVTSTLYGLVWTGSLWCVVGGPSGGTAAVLTSSNGTTWTRQTSTQTLTFNAVAYSGSVFCAVGDSGIVSTSTDGTTWTNQSSGTTTALYNIVWANNQFVATQSTGNVITSSDGVSWTTRSTGGSDSWRAMLYDEQTGTIYVGSINGVIKYSTDAITWNSRTTNTSTELHGGASNGPRIVIVGGNGVVLTSP